MLAQLIIKWLMLAKLIIKWLMFVTVDQKSLVRYFFISPAWSYKVHDFRIVEDMNKSIRFETASQLQFEIAHLFLLSKVAIFHKFIACWHLCWKVFEWKQHLSAYKTALLVLLFELSSSVSHWFTSTVGSFTILKSCRWKLKIWKIYDTIWIFTFSVSSSLMKNKTLLSPKCNQYTCTNAAWKCHYSSHALIHLRGVIVSTPGIVISMLSC